MFKRSNIWKQNKLGLNPIQAAMQIAIPEIDGATEAVRFSAACRQTEINQSRSRTAVAGSRAGSTRWNRLRVRRVKSSRLRF